MSTIIPQSELVKKAISWISEMLEGTPSLSLDTLIEQAGARYNLSPKEADFLSRFYREKND